MTVTEYELRFPQRQRDEVAQDVECVDVRLGDEWRRIRFHDYADIYALPGLYEQLFSDVLECVSPAVVIDRLAAHVPDPSALRVLDVGAGNGLVGEQLHALGAARVVGVDILDAAAEAAARDRPGVYDAYRVVDLTTAPDLGEFDAMVTVAALGFGDMPPDAFAVAFNLVVDGGLIAMNIKDDFLEQGDGSGFAGLLRRMIDDGCMEVIDRHRYRHRLSVTGEEFDYVAIVARKHRRVSVRP